LRILMTGIRFFPAPGGAETHIFEIAKRLRAHHEITIFTSDLYREVPFKRLPSDHPQFLKVEGIPVRRFRGYTLGGDMHYVFMPGMSLPMLRFKADIVHAHSYGYFQVNMAALKRLLQPDTIFVLTPHYHPEWSMTGGPKRKKLRKIYDNTIAKLVLDRADAIIGVSRHEIELMSRLGVDRRKIHIIPNGIDFSLYNPIPDPVPFLREYSLLERKKEGWKIVLYAGRLAVNKGLLHLINAAPMVLKENPRTLFVLVGDDAGMRERIEREIDRLNLRERFLLTGHIKSDEIYRSALSSCDVFVLPSEYEAFGIVLAEAMACEKPCVGTNVGGIPEVITDGETGLIVEYGDPAALADAINEILTSPEIGKNMGVKGRIKVMENFTWDKVVAAINRVYETFASEK